MRSTLSVQKSEVVAGGCMVTTLHPLAAEAGIAVMQGGGNAVDAAVTMAFMLAVVEPGMSGVGGGGCMVIYSPHDGLRCVIDHGMRAPRAATPEMYELLPDAGPLGLYGWPAVRDNANIIGHRSVAVPGSVAGLCLALERYGTVALDQALRPAIEAAEQGVDVTWPLGAHLAADARNLRRFPSTAGIFLRDGLPLAAAGVEEADRLVQADLARTLRLIAREGPAVFYSGEIGERIAAEMARQGGLLSLDDLAVYAPSVEHQDRLPSYTGHPIVGVTAGSGSTTTLEILKILEQFPLADWGHNTTPAVRVLAETFARAFADRFAYLGDPDLVEVPAERLWSREYAAEIAAQIQAAGPAGYQSPAHAGPAGSASSHTTHLSAVDRQRTSVALTQTLLSVFGSMVVVPETGILLNNGMMWFDPRPGRANSITGGKRCLSAVSPLILLDREGSGPFLVVGASGGRKIITAVAQVISNVVDHGMGIQAAVAAPRVHREVGEIYVDHRIGAPVAATLRTAGYQVLEVEESFTTYQFGVPSAIGVSGETGTLHSGLDPLKAGVAIGA